MCCCPKNTINVLKWEEPLFSFDDCFGNQDLKNQRISIKIVWTGPLAMSQYVLHPFVKIHLCDMNTMNYVAKENWDEKGVYHTEHAAYFNRLKEHSVVNVDYYLPIAT